MSLTSQDIAKQTFAKVPKGCDPGEVRGYLGQVAAVLDGLHARIAELETKVTEQDGQIEQLKAQESEIREVLVVAKRIGKDMERGARREADVIVGEARLEAERVLMDAAEERTKIERETLELRARRATLMGELRAVVESFGTMVADLEQVGTVR